MAGTGLKQEKKGKGDDSLGCRETMHPPPPPQPALLSSEVCALPEMSPNQPSQYGPYIPAGEYLSHNPTRKESISLPYILVVTSNDLGPGHGYIQLPSTSGPQNQPCLKPFKKSTARDCSQRAARPQPRLQGCAKFFLISDQRMGRRDKLEGLSYTRKFWGILSLLEVTTTKA